MALDPRELYNSTTQAGRKRIVPTYVAVKEIGTGTGTLKAGTVMAYDTTNNYWVAWVSGGANGTGTIRGILWPMDHTLNASNTTNAQIMLRGSAHADDLVDNATALRTNINAAMRSTTFPTLRSQGIFIEGLTQVV